MPKIGDIVIQIIVDSKKATKALKQLGATVEEVDKKAHKAEKHKITVDTNKAVGALKRLGIYIKKVDQEAHKASKHMHDSFQKRLGMGLMDLQMNMFQLVAVSGMLAFSLKKPIDKFAEFDKRIREIGTLLNDVSENTLRRFGAEIMDASVKFGQSFDRMAKARYDIISAGFTEAADSALILNTAAKLAVGGLSSVDRTAVSLTKVLNSFGESAQEVERVSDVLFTTVKLGQTTIDELVGSIGQVAPIARSAGLRIEDLGAALAVVTAGGLDTTIGTIALRGALQSLTAPVEQAEKAMKAAGIQIKRFDDGTLDLVETLKQFKGLPLEKIKEFVPDVRAANAIVVLSNNVDKLRYAINEMGNSAGASDKAFSEMAKGISFRIDQMKARFNKAVNEMGRTIVPLAEALIKMVEAFTNLPTKIQLTAMAFSAMILPLKILQIILSSFNIAIGPGGWFLIGLGALAAAVGLVSSRFDSAVEEIRNFQIEVAQFNLEQTEMELFRLDLKIRETTDLLKTLRKTAKQKPVGELGIRVQQETLNKIEDLQNKLDQLNKKRKILQERIKELTATRKKDTKIIIDNTIADQTSVEEQIKNRIRLLNLKHQAGLIETQDYKKALSKQLEIVKEKLGTESELYLQLLAQIRSMNKQEVEEQIKNRIRLLNLKRQAGLIETQDYKKALSKQLEIVKEKLGTESELYLQLLAQIRSMNKQEEENKKRSAQSEIATERERQTALLQLRKIGMEQYLQFLQKQADVAKEKYGEQSIEYLRLLLKIQQVNEQIKGEWDKLWQSNLEKNQLILSTIGAGYETFFQTILDGEMNAKERREAMWQSMKIAFSNTLSSMLKKFIEKEAKEAFIHTITEKTKTKVTKTQTAARSNISISALLKEGWQILKSIGKYIGMIAVKLFSWFASKGPIGIAVGFAAIPALVYGIRSAIRGLMKFEKGGIAKKETIGIFGEKGPEAIIPLNDQGAEFIAKVIPKITRPNINATSVVNLNRLELLIGELKTTIENLKLDAKIDATEMAIIVETGQKSLENMEM